MKLAHKLEYVLFRVMAVGVTALPYRTGLRVGAALGRGMFRTDRRHREIVLRNLQMAFPEKSRGWHWDMARRHFEHLVRSVVEFMWLAKNRQRVLSRITFEGHDHLERAKRAGKGIVLLLPHLGNWEIVGAMYPTMIKTATIAFPQSNSLMNDYVDGVREAGGLEVIPTGVAIRRVLEVLRQGYLVGFLADQDAGLGGIFVDFFGRPTCTAKGPAAFALKTGAPIHVTIIRRDEQGNHHMKIHAEIPLERTGDQERDIRVNTQRWSAIVEEEIRKCPEQWFWVHRRWKSVPLGVPYPYEGI